MRRVDELAAGAAVGVGRRVRRARTGRGWSLETLAARSGVGKGALVALEGGAGNPTLSTLVRVADGLGVSLVGLLGDAPEPPLRTWSAEEATLLWTGERGSTAHLLGGADSPAPSGAAPTGAVLELWRYALVEGEGRATSSHTPGTRELAHVLSGRLRVDSGPLAVQVGAGGCARLSGDEPHRYSGGPGGCVVLLCVSVPVVPGPPAVVRAAGGHDAGDAAVRRGRRP